MVGLNTGLVMIRTEECTRFPVKVHFYSIWWYVTHPYATTTSLQYTSIDPDVVRRQTMTVPKFASQGTEPMGCQLVSYIGNSMLQEEKIQTLLQSSPQSCLPHSALVVSSTSHSNYMKNSTAPSPPALPLPRLYYYQLVKAAYRFYVPPPFRPAPPS
jgi:hypothetical protein